MAQLADELRFPHDEYEDVTAALCSKCLVSGRYRIKQPRQFSMRCALFAFYSSHRE